MPIAVLPKFPVVRGFVMIATILVAIAVIVVALSCYWVRHSTADYIYNDAASLPKRNVAIVLGAFVLPNGTLSSVLRGRVDSAVALYKEGKVSKLLMTGDNGSKRYDEVTAMKKYAMAAGVPDIAIVRDYAGFRTFDSCYRAKHVFGVDRAVVVTQRFHLPRAIYIARHVGIDTVGFIAPDNMSRRSLVTLMFREGLATPDALLDVHLPWKRPHFQGQFDPISANRPGR